MQKVYRVLSMLLLCILAVMVPFHVSAAEIVASGDCGKNTTWALDDEGTLIISGTGKIEYDPWRNNKDQIKTLVIEEGVTEIAYRAFADLYYLTQVHISSTVSTINQQAFYSCSRLGIVYFNGQAPDIASNAFGHVECAVFFYPEDDSWVKVINKGYGGSSISWRTEGSNILSGECGESLEWVLNHTGKLTISGTGAMTDFVSSGPWLACANAVFSVELPDGLTNIGCYAFKYCENLKEIDIPNSVISIGSHSFDCCYSLSKVIIGTKVNEIKQYAFYGDKNIENIYFKGNAPIVDKNTFSYIDAIAYYPYNNQTWTQEKCETINNSSYQCSLTWTEHNYCKDSHSLIKDTEIAATCTESGLTEGFHCAICGEIIVHQEIIPATGHYYINGICCYCGNTHPFTDVPFDSFYYDPVLWAVEKGITSGTSDTTFSPADPCNRAQAVTFLWAAAGKPEPTITGHSFVDVPKGSFCEKAVLWAVEKGITTGTDETHFSPLTVCNRATIVTFLYKAFHSPEVNAAENPFEDVPDESWYTVPALWAKENGITSGTDATHFSPASICNRAQIVTFLYGAYSK